MDQNAIAAGTTSAAACLRDPAINKGTALSLEEQIRLAVDGLDRLFSAVSDYYPGEA